MTERILRSDGINWVWYCHVGLVDGSVTILKEYRIHKGDEGHPATEGFYEMIERKTAAWNEPRVIEAVNVNGDIYQLPQPLARWTLEPVA